MRALLQRVIKAQVAVHGETISEIATGWLVLLGVGKRDTERQVDLLLDKIMGLRLFSDQDGKFNLALKDVEGSLLIVSQFTLFADTSRGRRPGFSEAAPPEDAKKLYSLMLAKAAESGVPVKAGVFGADMKVSLVNDGPVTIMLDTDHF